MPRGYNGDCRDCVHYDWYFHKINDPEFDYRCDKCKECFKDRYGETCHLFEDKEDARQREIAEKNRKERDMLMGLALGGFFNQPDEEYEENNCGNNGESSANKGFPVGSLLLVGSVYGVIIIMGICFFGYAIKEMFFYELPKGSPKPNVGVESQIEKSNTNKVTPVKATKLVATMETYKELGFNGDERLLSIGTQVALRSKSDIKYYNTYFSETGKVSYRNERINNRVTKILDYRVTKYLGGARLKEELNFPNGVRVSGRVIYNIRKGYRIKVGVRKGDKYECIIPLRDDQSFRILLSREQFKAYDNNNWYLVNLPGNKLGSPVWVDGSQVNAIQKCGGGV